jgi:GT2 family glycosyltransferase
LTPHPNPEQPPPPPRVSVVVVSRNRVDRLRACLQSLEKSQGRERLQIIVVDNGSRDGSPQLETEFPNMQFSKLPKNFGLTKAMNIGWRAAEADYVFFLHEDTELEPDAIERLAGTLDAATEASGVCPLLLDAEGHPAPQLGNLPPEGQWRPAQPAGDEPMPVAYPRGAALMVRAFVIKSTRQIDERYGQFGADADIAAQIRRGGRKILLVPQARVRHYPDSDDSAMLRADFQLGRAAYLSKHHGFVAGMQARVGSVLGALASFRLSELRGLIAGQKIDGSQQ